jgi:O-acetyl-ADP-ribose deacetylase (regulator of RNase III)
MQYNSATINILQGDITKIPTQAIATLINSGKMWFGGADGAIMRVAGNAYHDVPNRRVLKDGDVIVAKFQRMHQGKFNDVIFVVDDLKRPLGELVEVALDAAYNGGYTSISFPAMRTGVMAGAYEPTARDAAMQMVAGMKRSIERHQQPITVNIVVYSDVVVMELLESAL